MSVINKIIAAVAVIIGLMAVVVGSRVLSGTFDPGYQYFTTLILYNVTVGLISIIAGILIWKNNSKALLLSGIIAVLHFSVLILLVTVFNNIISDHSIKAMIFRSVVWFLIFIVLFKIKNKIEDKL